MKQFLTFILAILCSTSIALATTYTGTTGDCTYTLDTDDGMLVISGTGAMANYSSYSSVPWYNYREYFNTVTIEDGVTSIGDYAFYNCTSLTSVTIPDGVTSIGDYAFYNCTSLTSITIPDAVTSIGDSAFYYCSSLTSITSLNTTPPTIYSSTFDELYSSATLIVVSCDYYSASYWSEFSDISYDGTGSCGDNLTWLYCDGTLTISGSGDMYDYSSAGEAPWYSYASSITSVTLSSEMTSIGDYAFYGLTSITSIEIPDAVTSIGSYAFFGCYNIWWIQCDATTPPTCDVENWSSPFSWTVYSTAILYVQSCYYYTASWWNQFENILYVDNGSCGDNLTWDYNAGGEDGNWWHTLTISGSGDMYDYSSADDVPWACMAEIITEIVIDSDVTSISDYAFYNCTNVTSVTSSASAPPTIYSSTFSDYSATLYAGSPEYLAADYWSSFYYINVTSQPCGDDLEYTLAKSKSTYSLSITGTGDMYDYTADTQPWSSCASKITSVSLTSDMTGIGNCAFCKCTSVSSITIPDAVTSIGDSAFYYCTSLASITIPDAVTTIGDYAFYKCSSLTSITIPDAVTSIGSHVFASCSTLSSVTLPDDLETLGEYMFSGCSKLKSITLPETLTSISNGAFSSTGLTSITIPDAVTTIGDYAFYYCDDFTSTLTLPDAVTSIGDYAFYYCQEDVPTLPDNLVTIGDYAFYYCSTCDVTIPDKVKTIGKYAFYGAASSSYYLVLGSSVEYIGSYAFSNSYFKKITSSNPTPPACYGTNVFSSYAYKYTYLYAESNLYEQAYVWEDFKYLYSTSTAKEVTTIIGLCGDDLTYTLSLSDSTLVIEGTGDMYDYGDNSRAPWYNYASFITSITLPDAMTSVGDYAFYNCSGITSLDIPSSLTSVGDYGFYNCDGLTSITLPDGVTSIGDYAFYDCDGLTSITLPDGVTSIGNYAFCSCGSLTDVTIPDAVTSIGNYAFYSCRSLTDVTIPDAVTSIGDYAFYDCYNLTSVTIGNGVTSIGNYAFYDCYNLTSVTIGSSVETIGEYAFYYCTSLTSVTSLAATPPTFIISSSDSSSAYPFSTSTYSTATLYAASTDYYTADYWKNFNSIIYKVYGTCGDGLTWSFNDGTLTISGSGDMYTYASTDDLPWADFASAVTDIIITSGVTSITDSAFYACENVETVSSYSTTPPTLAESAFNSTTYSSATLGVTSTNYLRADNWKNFSTTTTISADDEPEEETYSNAISSAAASTSTIRAIGNTIVITTETAQTAQVYSLAGQLLVKQTVAAGETSIGMPTGGVYVVALNDGTRAKVLVK